MTNGRDTKEGILNLIETADRGAIISKGLDSDVDEITSRAQTEKTSYSLKGLTQDPFDSNGTPRYTVDAFNALSEEDKEKKIDEGLAWRQSNSARNAVNALAHNLESVLKEGDIYDPKLVDIAGTEPVVKSADASQRELLQAYGQYDALRRLHEKIQNNEPPEIPEAELIKIVSASEYKTQFDYLRSQGYNDKLADLGGKLAMLAPSEEPSNEKLLRGIRKRRVDEERDLKNKHGDDYREKVAEAVGQSIEKMATSGDTTKEQLAIALFYDAHRGYAPGEREFREVFS